MAPPISLTLMQVISLIVAIPEMIFKKNIQWKQPIDDEAIEKIIGLTEGWIIKFN